MLDGDQRLTLARVTVHLRETMTVVTRTAARCLSKLRIDRWPYARRPGGRCPAACRPVGQQGSTTDTPTGDPGHTGGHKTPWNVVKQRTTM